MDVRRGEIFALLGPNGAGKTTLIKILLGIIRSSQGGATVLGAAAGNRGIRRNVGYLPEHLRISGHHTARSALQFYGQLGGMSPQVIRKRRDALLSKVGLAGRDRESVKRFSKGMLQRLGLAQALLHDPQLLIMDEPTDGLDPIGRSQVRAILQELRDQGRTVFINSHLLQEVELICDRVAILHRGQLKYLGAVQQLQPENAGTVELRLCGARDAISRILPEASIVSDRFMPDAFSVTLALPDFESSDELVDKLRSAQIGIRELKWKGRTLEDAFLSVIEESSEVEAPSG